LNKKQFFKLQSALGTQQPLVVARKVNVDDRFFFAD